MVKQQRSMAKQLAILVLIVLALCSVQQVQAQTVMHRGTITTAPWFDRYYYLKLDHIKYMFMPKVQIDADFTRYKPQPMTPALARNLKVGTSITVAKQGFRIYRVYFPGKEGTGYAK